MRLSTRYGLYFSLFFIIGSILIQGIIIDVEAQEGEYDGTEDELFILYHLNNNMDDDGMYNIPATNFGGLFVAGMFEEGLEFDGIDDNVLIFMNFTITPPLTLTFWLKPHDTSTVKDQYIASRQDSFNVYHNQDDLTFEYRKNIGSWVTHTLDNILEQGKWQKFSFQVSSNTEFLTIWKNEIQIFNIALTGAWQPDINNVYIGSYWDNTSYYDGLLDELTAWNTTYTPLFPAGPPDGDGVISYSWSWNNTTNIWTYNNDSYITYNGDTDILTYYNNNYSYDHVTQQWITYNYYNYTEGGGIVEFPDEWDLNIYIGGWAIEVLIILNLAIMIIICFMILVAIYRFRKNKRRSL